MSIIKDTIKRHWKENNLNKTSLQPNTLYDLLFKLHKWDKYKIGDFDNKIQELMNKRPLMTQT